MKKPKKKTQKAKKRTQNHTRKKPTQQAKTNKSKK
jgi:hypothetical protein